MERILRESERTSSLVDDLLFIARSDSDPAAFERNPIDLSPLLADVTIQARTLAEPKRIEVVPQLSSQCVWMEGDELSIRRLVMTLIDNAVKYTPDCGKIFIGLHAEDRFAVIAIRDTGMGIASEDLPRVFDRFWRADKVRSRDEGGTGLGLSIAKGIAERHQGTIAVESQLGRGSSFTVRLPLLLRGSSGDDRGQTAAA
jgi:signal transduction histidine kinase